MTCLNIKYFILQYTFSAWSRGRTSGGPHCFSVFFNLSLNIPLHIIKIHAHIRLLPSPGQSCGPSLDASHRMQIFCNIPCFSRAGIWLLCGFLRQFCEHCWDASRSSMWWSCRWSTCTMHSAFPWFLFVTGSLSCFFVWERVSMCLKKTIFPLLKIRKPPIFREFFSIFSDNIAMYYNEPFQPPRTLSSSFDAIQSLF